MRIGKIAAAAAVTIPTIRFYERRGLLQQPLRQASGYRDYPSDAVQRVRFIKQSQALGFSLEEIAQLLQLQASSSGHAAEVRSIAQNKLHCIEEKMRSLRTMRDELCKVIAACNCSDEAPHCLMLEPKNGKENTVSPKRRK